ncbi:MAG TPA: DUF4252 domain-containing protein [Bryobacteraceae bacterium]|nr:DUF4252 domain-containing protein [Bryobacteraceae bacterium]
MRIAAIIVSAALAPCWSQQMKLPANLESLSAKAQNTVEVTLDSTLLRLAGRLLSDSEDEARVKKLIAGLEGIYVRSYEFAGEDGYNRADLDAIRAQLQPPAWSRIVGVKSKHGGEDVDVYLKISDDGTLGGVVLLAAEPRELTIVNIVGKLDPAQLSDLGGHFHIPKLDCSSCAGWQRDSI